MEKCKHQYKFKKSEYVCIYCGANLQEIIKNEAAEEMMQRLEQYIGLKRDHWTSEIKERDIYPMIDYLGKLCQANGEAEKPQQVKSK